jgi:Arc/MetJ-type ribon-helix-helix transcriptional regulator
LVGLTKKKTSVSLDYQLLSWVEKKINEKRFASVSHAVEYALEELKKREP